MRSRESGQAILFIVIAMGIFMIGAMGLAIDGSNLYTHRTMAQVAADAAAQGAIMSIFNNTNVGANAFSRAGGAFTCTTTDVYTPCAYSRLNRFGDTTADAVAVSWPDPATFPGVPNATELVQVTITRTLPTSFMALLGTSTSSVRAISVAAIVLDTGSIPIIVTHPTLNASFALNGSGGATGLRICGGGNRSIQVNSSSATAVNVSGNFPVDLSRAGKNDPGNCTTGTGADFDNHGAPITYPGVLLLGSTGHYVQPASIINDPLAGIAQPSPPALALPTVTLDTTLAPPLNQPALDCGCPAGEICTLYLPGRYTGGIQVQNQYALFAPGLYYMDGGGFKMQSNSAAKMATAATCTSIPVPVSPDTGNGMTVFNTGNTNNDLFEFTANAGTKGPITLVGADRASTYQSILFFEDRTAAAHTGIGGNKGHALQGGGTISLTGTIYITNTAAIMSSTPGQYQNLSLQGNPGSTTTIIGEIIASALSLGGDAQITMELDPSATQTRFVALVK